MADGDRGVIGGACFASNGLRMVAWAQRQGDKARRFTCPLARTCHTSRGLVGGVIGVGEEDDTMAGGWLTCGAHVVAAAGEV